MLVALGMTGLVAVLVRLKGAAGVEPHSGGWRELTSADLE